MKKTSIVVLSVVVLLCLTAGFVYAGVEFEQKSAQLVTELHKFFPDRRGTVVSVQDATVFIDLGIEQRIVKNAQFALLQDGVEIVHPTTGKVLGRYEKQFGTLQVTDVMENFSIATVLWKEPGKEIQQGDSIGKFPGRIKIGVLPAANFTDHPIDLELLYTLFIRTLKADERFTVFDEADLKAAALNAGVSSENLGQELDLSQVNTVLHAHNFLQLELHPMAEEVLLQATVLDEHGNIIGKAHEIIRDYVSLQELSTSAPNVPSEKAVSSSSPSQAPPEVEVVAEASLAEQTPDSSEKKPQDAAQNQGSNNNKSDKFWQTDAFRLKAHKITFGDTTGNGKNEMILSTPYDLYLYNQTTFEGRSLYSQFAQIEGYNDALILALGVADINGNGRQEIFVTTLRNKTSEVRVFEYTDGTFKEIWKKVGVALRVIHTPSGKTYLAGQSATGNTSITLLIGQIAKYSWDGSDYVREGTLNIPGRVKFFDFTLGDVNSDGSEDVVFYDNRDRINVFQNGKRLWRSRNEYTGYKFYLDRTGQDEEPDLIPGEINLAELGPQKSKALVVFKNIKQFGVARGLPLYKGSQLYVFQWSGTKFAKTFTSEEFDYYSVDYAIADVDNDGKQEVALAMVLQTDDYFRKPKSQVVFFELE
jgi:hypothetical protein